MLRIERYCANSYNSGIKYEQKKNIYNEKRNSLQRFSIQYEFWVFHVDVCTSKINVIMRGEWAFVFVGARVVRVLSAGRCQLLL